MKYRDAEKKKEKELAKRAKELTKKLSQEEWKRKLLKGGIQLDITNGMDLKGAAEVTIGLPHQSLLHETKASETAMTVVGAEDEKKGEEKEKEEEEEEDEETQDERDLKGRFWTDITDCHIWAGEMESMISAIRLQEYVYLTSGEDLHCIPFMPHSGHLSKLDAMLKHQAGIKDGTDQWVTSFRDFAFEECLSLECRSLYRRGLLTDLIEVSAEEKARNAFLEKAKANSKPQVLIEKEFGFQFSERLFACINDSKLAFFETSHDFHDLFFIHFFSHYFRQVSFYHR